MKQKEYYLVQSRYDRRSGGLTNVMYLGSNGFSYHRDNATEFPAMTLAARALARWSRDHGHLNDDSVVNNISIILVREEVALTATEV